MTFDKILEDGRLWAVRYDGKEDNCFDELFSHDGMYKRPSWLRIYAIKVEEGTYVVTGGAIKLTATMSERKHTLAELAKLELVRNLFIDNGVYDKDGLEDYIENERSN